MVQKKVLNFPFLCSKVKKKLRRFSKHLRSRATSQPQLFEALSSTSYLNNFLKSPHT